MSNKLWSLPIRTGHTSNFDIIGFHSCIPPYLNLPFLCALGLILVQVTFADKEFCKLPLQCIWIILAATEGVAGNCCQWENKSYFVWCQTVTSIALFSGHWHGPPWPFWLGLQGTFNTWLLQKLLSTWHLTNVFHDDWLFLSLALNSFKKAPYLCP